MVPNVGRNRFSLDSKGNSALSCSCEPEPTALAWRGESSTRSSSLSPGGWGFSFRSLLIALAVVCLGATGLLAQYSTTKFIDPNTFPTDTTPGFGLGATPATDGTYVALSTYDAVWSKTVTGGTPVKLFSIGTNLPSSTVPASYIYGAVEIDNGTIVFYANGATSNGTQYGIYSVPADGSGSAVRVADSTQVASGVWYEDVDIYGRYGLFAVSKGTVVFGIGGAIYSAGTDGSNLTTLWQTNNSFTGCSTNGTYSGIFLVTGASDPATDGTNYAFSASSDLSFVGLYTGPLTTPDTCDDLITSGTCNICGPVSTLPGQPQPGTAFTFQDLVQIDGDYVYFMADAGAGVSSTEDYYGLFKVPLAGGAATAVVTNISQIPALKNVNGTYDQPNFAGYAVKNGKIIFYAGDNTQGGTAAPAFYMVQGSNYVPVFTNQTVVDNECIGNMTDSTLAGLVQPELTADGHLYFSAEYITTGPYLDGTCNYAFLRFNPYAYYVVDTNHPLIPAQATITMTPAPANVTTSTPVSVTVQVGPTSGTGNPGGLIPTGTVWIWYTSPQIYGVQDGQQMTLDNTGKATFQVGDLYDFQYNFTVSYGGDVNFTQSGSNAIALDLRPPAAATLTTPAPGSILAGSSVGFGWSAGAHVTNYQLMLGTTGVGSSNVYNSGSTTATSVNVTGIPTTGATLYARLSSEIAGTWSSADYTYTEASPAPTLSSTSLSFGSVYVGAAGATQYVALTNKSTNPLPLSSIAVTGANASSFAFVNNCGMSLAAGASCSIHGHFAPVASGALTAAVTITDSAINSPQTITLSGTGVEPPVTLSATSLSYAPTIVGMTSGSQTVTMTNSGTAAVSITSIAVTGAGATSFVFANSCGTSLAVGASCTIHGHFAPATTGALKAAIAITDSASTSPQSIALSGTGLAPPVTLSATSLSFGSTTVDTSSGSQSVTMTNTGTAALSITSIAVTGAKASEFVFANSCGTSLAVGANCTIHGHFAPTAAGAVTAAVTITDSASTSPQTIALSGTGVQPAAPVTLSATSLSFGATTVGASSGSQSVTMTNTGTAALSIASIAVTGAKASEFVFANSCGTSLAVGASCTIHGHFAPTATGAATAAVTITDSATGSPQSIALSGTGQ